MITRNILQRVGEKVLIKLNVFMYARGGKVTEIADNSGTSHTVLLELM